MRKPFQHDLKAEIVQRFYIARGHVASQHTGSVLLQDKLLQDFERSLRVFQLLPDGAAVKIRAIRTGAQVLDIHRLYALKSMSGVAATGIQF